LRLREVVRGADLGSSSNYSDEIHPTLWELLALKTVVEKVSLSMAIGLTFPNSETENGCKAKSLLKMDPVSFSQGFLSCLT
jgi:hypothetical protein